jgi:hypothetical protein
MTAVNSTDKFICHAVRHLSGNEILILLWRSIRAERRLPVLPRSLNCPEHPFIASLTNTSTFAGVRSVTEPRVYSSITGKTKKRYLFV